jgi:hypothetical protein
LVNYLQGDDPSDDLRRKLPDIEPKDEATSADEARLERLRALEASRKLSPSKGKTNKLVGTKRKQKLAQMQKMYGISGGVGGGEEEVKPSPTKWASADAEMGHRLAAMRTPNAPAKFGLDSARDGGEGVEGSVGGGGSYDDDDLSDLGSDDDGL